MEKEKIISSLEAEIKERKAELEKEHTPNFIIRTEGYIEGLEWALIVLKKFFL